MIRPHRECHLAGTTALGAALGVTAAVGAAVRLRQWGSTRSERAALLPGDELIEDPGRRATLAVSIDAPPAAVWPWLLQMGQDRGGLYSYDRVENLVGLDIHSADTIRPEWQERRVGDRVVLVGEGWMGLPAGYSLPIAMIDTESVLVLRQQPPEHPWNAIWSFVLIPEGGRGTRLLSRTLTARRRGMSGCLAAVAAAGMDPVTAIMTRRMLLGIKQRAEGISDAGCAAPR
jgi:hypothetical protein